MVIGSLARHVMSLFISLTFITTKLLPFANLDYNAVHELHELTFPSVFNMNTKSCW